MKNKSTKSRAIVVIGFILLIAIISFINIRGSYLQYKELGENYLESFWKNQNYKYTIFGINFVILYISIYFTNRSIKKGLKEFFDKEKKEMPRLINKSIAFVLATILGYIATNILMKKILLCMSNVSFAKTDPVFNLDIAFYMFQKPLIESLLIYLITIIIGLSIYMSIYYIIVFNKHFDGIDKKMLIESLFIKKLLKNVILIVIAIAILTAINITDISLSKMITIKSDAEQSENIELIGAGYSDIMLQRWAYLIFSVVIIVFSIRAVNAFKKGNTTKTLKNLIVIPGYLVTMFIVMIAFDLIFVNSNKFDKQKQYIERNIEYTKNAFSINIEEKSKEDIETISKKDVDENSDIINNIKILNEDVVLKTLAENQTGKGHYSYRNANIAKYKINAQDKLIYVSPREILNSGRTYNNKTYEYTHGLGQIAISATDTDEVGHVKYIQKDVSGQDDELGTTKQEIYFGLETNSAIATNIKDKEEYDYTDENGNEHTSKYSGNAGLKLGFWDKIILGIKTGNLKIAFTGNMTDESKILVNRNIIKRAKKAMPYLIYDEKPYTVVTDEGKIVWVLDAYTISSKYPYSQYISIEHDSIKEKINYIRNSVKVIIDAYDGTMKFYITDDTDPIAMAYKKLYPSIFEETSAEIDKDISEHFIYPEFLYNVQSNLLKVYHNVKADVLYRTDDIWNYAKYNNTMISKSSGMILKPYYTLVDSNGNNEIGLIQIYTPETKQNMIAYLVGTVNGSKNELKLHKFSQDSNTLGTMQLDNQIEQDENIWKEIQSLNTTGMRVTKEMIVVPVKDTLLYVEPIYQTKLNEESKIPTLKKIIVASGNKVAIGNNFNEALSKLLSTSATNIEVESTDDVDGLIDAIVKANKNLEKSTVNKDWELMGTDIKKLQDLIHMLEEEKAKEDKKKAEQNKNNNMLNTVNVVENNINSTIIE